MKFGLTWMTVAAGAFFLGGWGSKPASQAAQPDVSVISGRSACTPEVLRWQYDEASRVLRLDDGRVRLDCCGQRMMSVERADSVLEVTQRDEPDAGGRCATQCAYDLTVSVADVQAGETYVKLLRDVTDQGGSPSLVWQGSLALAQGAGEVVLDAGCGESAR